MPVNRKLAAASLTLALLAGAAPAWADDLVLLTNGGRLRGAVVSEHPKEGVKIKLADGRVRTIPAAEVKQVVYEGEAPKDVSPPAALPPVALPPVAPPPPPAPPKVGSLSVTSEAPAKVLVDWVEVGATPLKKDDLPVGPHEVRVSYEGGDSDGKSVEITDKGETKVAFTLTESERLFRGQRRGSVGFSVDAVALYASSLHSDLPSEMVPFGGLRASLFVNLAVNSYFDVRLGAFGGVAVGEGGGRVHPAGILGAMNLHGSRIFGRIGVIGGVMASPGIRKWLTTRADDVTLVETVGMVGPNLAVGVLLGERREVELGLLQEFWVAPGRGQVTGSTGLGITYVFRGAAAPKATTARRSP